MNIQHTEETTKLQVCKDYKHAPGSGGVGNGTYRVVMVQRRYAHKASNMVNCAAKEAREREQTRNEQGSRGVREEENHNAAAAAATQCHGVAPTFIPPERGGVNPRQQQPPPTTTDDKK